MLGYRRKLQPGSIPKIWKDIGKKTKRTKSKSSEEDRKQQVSHLKTERKNKYWILPTVEIFKKNLKQVMFWESNKYSTGRKEDLQSYDLYSRVE